MAVAAQEIFEPQHVAIAGGADDDRPAGAGFQKTDAPQGKSAGTRAERRAARRAARDRRDGFAARIDAIGF